jgi:hypothetical protein
MYTASARSRKFAALRSSRHVAHFLQIAAIWVRVALRPQIKHLMAEEPLSSQYHWMATAARRRVKTRMTKNRGVVYFSGLGIMARCVQCGKETDLHVNGVPICPTCDGKREKKPPPPKPLKNAPQGSK